MAETVYISVGTPGHIDYLEERLKQDVGLRDALEKQQIVVVSEPNELNIPRLAEIPECYEMPEPKSNDVWRRKNKWKWR